MHSFRIFLASALYAAGCPQERIMAMLRWKSAEALAIYARLNDGVSAELRCGCRRRSAHIAHLMSPCASDVDLCI